MVNVINIPISRQEENYTCGAAVVKSILQSLGTEISEKKLVKKLSTTSKNGTDPKSIIHFLKTICHCNDTYFTGLEQVKKLLDNNHPIIVLLQAWGTPSNYKTGWKSGHYAIIIGYDKEKLFFMDPSSEKYTYINQKEFLERWHDKDKFDNKLKNFGIVLHHTFPITTLKESNIVKTN